MDEDKTTKHDVDQDAEVLEISVPVQDLAVPDGDSEKDDVRIVNVHLDACVAG